MRRKSPVGRNEPIRYAISRECLLALGSHWLVPGLLGFPLHRGGEVTPFRSSGGRVAGVSISSNIIAALAVASGGYKAVRIANVVLQHQVIFQNIVHTCRELMQRRRQPVCGSTSIVGVVWILEICSPETAIVNKTGLFLPAAVDLAVTLCFARSAAPAPSMQEVAPSPLSRWIQLVLSVDSRISRQLSGRTFVFLARRCAL